MRRLGYQTVDWLVERPYRSRIDHPRYLAYVPGEGTWPAALGDLIASTYNIDVGNWMESAGPSQLEATVLRWFAEWIGYPPESGGVLVSGGSAANLTAMACAREALVGAMSDDLVAYVSEQGHLFPSRGTPPWPGRLGCWTSGPSRCASCPWTRGPGCGWTRLRPRSTPTSPPG